MKLLCYGVLWLLPTLSSAQQVVELNLAEAIALALRQNRTVENAYLNRIVEKFDLRIARDEFSPKLNIGADLDYAALHQDTTGRDYNRNYRASGIISLQVPTGGQLALTTAHTANIADSEVYSDSVELGFSQPLLKGGGTTVGTANLVLAERQEESNLLRLKDTLISTITGLIKQYRNYVSATRALEISQLSLERSRKQLEVTRELIDNGRLPAVELVQSQTDVANQELSLRSTENALDAARINLLLILRLSPDTEIVATESLQVAKFARELQELETIAFANRSDYRQAEIALDNAELQLALAENNRLWQLDLSVRYGLSRSGDDSFPPLQRLDAPNEGDYQVGLQLEIPLWTLEPRRQVVAAKVNLKQTGNRLQELEEFIILQLQDTFRNLQIRWEQVALSERSLDLSRQQLDLEQEKLKAGRSSSFRVVSFQNSLVQAENNYLNTQIAYLNALTDLDEILGITLQNWGVSLEPADRVMENP